VHVRFSAAAALWPKHEAAQETFLLSGLSGFVTAADKRFVFAINVESNTMRITIWKKFQLSVEYIKIFDIKQSNLEYESRKNIFDIAQQNIVAKILYILSNCNNGLHIIIFS